MPSVFMVLFKSFAFFPVWQPVFFARICPRCLYAILEVTHWEIGVWRVRATNSESYFYSLNGAFWWIQVPNLKTNLSLVSLFIVGPVHVLFTKLLPVPGSQGCSFFFSKSFIVFSSTFRSAIHLELCLFMIENGGQGTLFKIHMDNKLTRHCLLKRSFFFPLHSSILEIRCLDVWTDFWALFSSICHFVFPWTSVEPPSWS